MDRLKYRIWDKINDVWIEGPFLDVRKGCISGYYMPEEAMKRRIIVEQCTGTKSKNGKLIYEGDVIKTPNGSIGHIVWSQQDLGFNVKDLNPKEKEVYLVECEVIGNIHENKDLLGEE